MSTEQPRELICITDNDPLTVAVKWCVEIEHGSGELPNLPWLNELCKGLCHPIISLPEARDELLTLIEKIRPILIGLRKEWEYRSEYSDRTARIWDDDNSSQEEPASPKFLRRLRALRGRIATKIRSHRPKWMIGLQIHKLFAYRTEDLFSHARDNLIDKYREIEKLKSHAWERLVKNDPVIETIRVRSRFFDRYGKITKLGNRRFRIKGSATTSYESGPNSISNAAHDCFLEMCNAGMALFTRETITIFRIMQFCENLERRILDRLAEIETERTQFSRPLCPNELHLVFDHSWRCVKDWLSVNGGPIESIALSDRAYLIDIAMLPADWEDRLNAARGSKTDVRKLT